MRSVTSCFNSTLYRKNLSRFWPIWALYSVIWLFALPLNLLTTIQRGQNWALEDLTHSLDYFSRVSVGYSLNLGTVLAVIFGLLAAMAVFSYLDASRSACMMHALPLRREALFFTNYLSGLSFLLLPNAAIFGLTLAGEAVGNCLDLKALAIWLLVQSASCLFFYSFAVFCAMFTGHLLALPVFYGVLNCLAAIISALMDSVLYLFLYGYNGLSGTTQQAVAWLTPLEKLGGAVSWTQAADSGAYQLAQPAVVAVYAGVGVALSAAALLIYRARQMESAGDVVSVRVVRPIFKYGVAVCAGLSGGTFTYYVLFGDGQLSLVLSILFWAAVGYFLAEMLLRKSFRVFSAWPGCLVLLALLSALFLCIRLDLTGYQDYIPASGEVSQVTVDLEGSTYPSDGLVGAIIEGRRFPPQIKVSKILTYASTKEAISAVNRGDADFVYGLASHLEREMQRSHFTNVVPVTLVNERTDICLALANPADPDLLTILNKTVNSLSSERRYELLDQNTVSVGTGRLSLTELIYANPVMFIGIFALILLLAVVAILWISRTKVKSAVMRSNLEKAHNTFPNRS